MTDVSTLSEPGRVGPEDGVVLVLELAGTSCPRLILASNEVDPSVGSLFVLADRARPSGLTTGGGGAPSAPGATPFAGSSV